MRIRKRQVPLPLSSLSPVPLSSLSLSDPFSLSGSGGRSPVQLNLRPSAPATADDFIHNNNLKSSDQAPNRASITDDHPEMLISGEEKPNIPNDSSVSTTPTKIGGPTGILHQSGTSNRGGGARWCQGPNSAFLLKKRRNQNSEEEGKGEEIKNAGTTENKWKNVPSLNSGSSRKRGRGGGAATVLEGSRCSRVNGRGWRCCQPTLVGYSLCEHHLGKGRLRSMTNVRGRHQTKRPKAPVLLGSSQDTVEEPKDEDQDKDLVDEQKKAKKGTKLGVVKARSMSSLLGQGSNSNANADSSSSSATLTAAAVEAVHSDNIEAGER